MKAATRPVLRFRSRWGWAILGVACGLGLWWVIPGPERVRQAHAVGAGEAVATRDEIAAHGRAQMGAERVGALASEGEGIPSDLPPRVKLALAPSEVMKLHASLMAPQLLTSEGILSSAALNPDGRRPSADASARLDVLLAGARSSAQALAKEVEDVTARELVELRDSGVGGTFKADESPFAKFGFDAVFTKNLATGEGLGASLRKMPKLRAARSRLSALGCDMVLRAAEILVSDGVLSDQGLELIRDVVADVRAK